MDSSHDYIFKIILIGDSGVGKTSLMTRFTDKEFNESLMATIGVDFKIKTILLDNTKVKLQIWDTAGQERFRAVVSNYYRGANGIFIVFDLTNRNSFEHLDQWLDELRKKNAIATSEITVLGNKLDNLEERKIAKEDIEKFLENNDIPCTNYFEVSAKTDIMVETCFIELTKRLVRRFGPRNVKQLSSKETFNSERYQNRKGCC